LVWGDSAGRIPQAGRSVQSPSRKGGRDASGDLGGRYRRRVVWSRCRSAAASVAAEAAPSTRPVLPGGGARRSLAAAAERRRTVASPGGWSSRCAPGRLRLWVGLEGEWETERNGGTGEDGATVKGGMSGAPPGPACRRGRSFRGLPGPNPAPYRKREQRCWREILHPPPCVAMRHWRLAAPQSLAIPPRARGGRLRRGCWSRPVQIPPGTRLSSTPCRWAPSPFFCAIEPGSVFLPLGELGGLVALGRSGASTPMID